jgi:hypothetical protein
MGEPVHEKPEAEKLFDGIIARLLAMTADPPFRFLDTSRADAAEFLRRQKTFAGYSDDEIEAEEQDLGVQFPAVFRAYLRAMGRARGALFRGSDVAKLEDLERSKESAIKVMQRAGDNCALPSGTVVFLLHQGYTFLCFHSAGGYDTPVHQYFEQEKALRQISSGFAEFVQAEVQVVEGLHRKQHKSGGKFITLDGSGQMWSWPSAVGERALDHPHRFTD